MLEVTGLSKYYYNGDTVLKAVDNVSFSVKEGEFLGIMGVSGSGKTTLLNAISSIVRDFEGKVEIDGVNLHDMKLDEIVELRKKKIGFIFQDYNLLDSLTVEENIALPLLVDNNSLDKHKDKVYELASELGIENILKHFPYETSGGQQQRVACARALIMKPKIIFADEPTGALDSKMTTNLLNILKNINLDKRQCIIMVTHDPYSASFCNRILVMEDGKIHKEILRNSMNQEQFYKRIVKDTLQFEENYGKVERG